jgi:uncharacterized protein
MVNLAVLYQNGRGVARDESLALAWYQKAAETGYRPAARRMAEIYRDGQLGQNRDPARAQFWAERAL